MSPHHASPRSSDDPLRRHGGPSTSALWRAAPLALDDAREQFESLTSGERSVLQRVAEGYSVIEIARLLSYTPKTVNAYTTRIARKLGFTHRTDYVRFALQLGLIGSSSTQQGARTTGSR